MKSDTNSTPIPLTDRERTALRREIDADALSRLFLLIDPETRRLILSLLQRKTPPLVELAESVRCLVGDVAAEQVLAHGPNAVWIDFPDPEQKRLWHRVLGVPLPA
jgi:hypothetical protein